MIIVRLVGGTASQMFLYAAARRLAHRRKTELKLDVRLFAPEVQTRLQFPRHFALGAFNISGLIATSEEIAAFEAVRERSRFAMIKDFIGVSARPRRIYHVQREFPFNPHVLGLPDNVYLDGNLGSEKYFLDIEDIIRNEFTFKEEPTGRNRELVEEVSSVDSVSIHIRRGDFAAIKKLRDVHGLCEIEYYQKCVRMITDSVPAPHFFIFSDEPQWAKQNLRTDRPTVYVDHNSPEQAHEDLRIMSNCQHNIIANSGFSWWGAWLNPNPLKIICAPKRWFNTSKYDTRDLVPEGWIRV